MQWFKHYSNVRDSNYITNIKANLGLEGYARYWILVEMMAQKFDGLDTKFTFSIKDLKNELGFYHTKELIKFLDFLSTSHTALDTNGGLDVVRDVSPMSFQSNGNVVTIKFDILLKLQGKDFKYDKKRRYLAVGDSDPKNKNKNKNKNICTPTQSVGGVNGSLELEEIQTPIQTKFDFETLYQLYPKRPGDMGKATGMDRLRKKIKSQKKFDQFKSAVQNYKRMVDEGLVDKRFVKMWSTFANCYEDFLPENTVMPKESPFETF